MTQTSETCLVLRLERFQTLTDILLRLLSAILETFQFPVVITKSGKEKSLNSPEKEYSWLWIDPEKPTMQKNNPKSRDREEPVDLLSKKVIERQEPKRGENIIRQNDLLGLLSCFHIHRIPIGQ